MRPNPRLGTRPRLFNTSTVNKQLSLTYQHVAHYVRERLQYITERPPPKHSSDYTQAIETQAVASGELMKLMCRVS